MATERADELEIEARTKLLQPTQPSGPGVESHAIKQGAIATSHNTFRPDIYRVSEGYLN